MRLRLDTGAADPSNSRRKSVETAGLRSIPTEIFEPKAQLRRELTSCGYGLKAISHCNKMGLSSFYSNWWDAIKIIRDTALRLS